jgi:hypothetical protein
VGSEEEAVEDEEVVDTAVEEEAKILAILIEKKEMIESQRLEVPRKKAASV